jgi:hypothetical protein
MKAQRDDLRNESDKLLMDLIDSEKERDAFQAKLDIAVKALKRISNTDIPQERMDWREAHNALTKIEKIGGMNDCLKTVSVLWKRTSRASNCASD